MTAAVQKDPIIQAIKKYDAQQQKQVAGYIRSSSGLSSKVNEIENLYQQAISDFKNKTGIRYQKQWRNQLKVLTLNYKILMLYYLRDYPKCISLLQKIHAIIR